MSRKFNLNVLILILMEDTLRDVLADGDKEDFKSS